MPLPQLETRMDIPGLYSARENILSARTARQGQETYNAIQQSNLEEIRDPASELNKRKRAETRRAELEEKFSGQKIEEKNLDLAMKKASMMRDAWAGVTPETYPQLYNNFKATGEDVSRLPTPEEIRANPEKLQPIKENAVMDSALMRDILKDKAKTQAAGEEKRKLQKMINDTKIQLETLKKEGKVPEDVVKAQNFILNLAKRKQPTMAQTLATAFLNQSDPTAAGDELMNLQMGFDAQDIPDNLKGPYENAVKILDNYYKGQANKIKPRLTYSPTEGLQKK